MKLFQKNEQKKSDFISALFLVNFNLQVKFKYSKLICICFLSIQLLQPLYYIVGNNLSQMKMKSGFAFEAFQFLIRFEYFLLNNYSMTYAYIFILILSVINYSYLYLIVYTNKIKNEKKRIILQFFNAIKKYDDLVVFYQQMLPKILYLPFTALCLDNLENRLNQNETKSTYIIEIIFISVSIIIIQINSIFNLLTCTNSLTYSVNFHETLHITSLSIIIYIMKLWSQIIFHFDQSLWQIKYLEAIIVSIISLLEIVNQYFYQSYILLFQRYMIYVFNSFILIYSILILIQFNVNQFSESFFCILIITTPIFPYILINLEQIRSHHDLIECISNKFIEKKVILRFLTEQINNIQIQKSIISFRNAIIGSSHYSQCVNPKCIFCSTKFVSETFSGPGLTWQIQKQFYYQLIQNFIDNNQELKTKFSSKQTIQMHKYAFLLFDLKWYHYSLQIFNNFLHLSTPSNNQSNQYYGNTFRTTIDRTDLLTQQTTQKQITKTNLVQDNSIVQNVKQSTQSFSALIYCKVIFLKSQTIQMLQNNFGTTFNTDIQSDVKQFFQFYLKDQQNLHMIQNQFIRLLRYKLEIYNSLDHQTNGQKLFKKLLKFGKLYLKCEKKINNSQKYFQSLRLAQIFSYFHCYISKNYYLAIKYVKQNQKHKNINYINWKKIDLEQNLSNTGYFIVLLDNDVKSILIQKSSSYFKTMFNIDESNPNIYFEQLFPNFLLFSHGEAVQTFLVNGIASFYNNFSRAYLIDNNKMLQSTKFGFTEMQDQNSLKFSVIIQILQLQQNIIIIDANSEVFIATKPFFQTFGFDDQKIIEITKQLYHNNIKITQFFPDFNNYLLQLDDEIKIFNAQYRYPRELNGGSSEIKIYTTIKIISNEKSYLQDNSDSWYKCHLIIKKRLLSSSTYYFMELFTFDDQDHSEQIVNQALSKKNSKYSYDIATHQSPQISLSPIIDGLKKNKIATKELLFENIKAEKKNQEQQSNPLTLQINSPNISQNQKPLLNANDTTLQGKSPSRQIKQITSENPKSFHEIEDQENINIDRESSLLKSDSFRLTNSQMINILNNIQEKRYKPQKLEMLRNLVYFVTLIQILFQIIIFCLTEIQLSYFQEAIVLLGFDSSIIAPQDQFLSSMLQLKLAAKYTIGQEELQIRQELLKTSFEYLQQQFELSSNDLILQQLLHSYSYDLLLVDNYDINLSENMYTLKISTLLDYIVQYSYTLKQDYFNTNVVAWPHNIIANYYQLQMFLISMNSDIQDTLNNDKMYYTYVYEILLITQVIITFLFLIIITWNAWQYYNQMEKILKLFNSFQNNNITNEIKNLKLLIGVSKYADILMETDGQIEQEIVNEQCQNTENQIQQTHIKSQVKKVKNVKFSRFKISCFITFFFLILLIFYLCDVVVKISFMSNFYSSLDLSKKYSNMKMRCGNVYIYKDMLKGYSQFTYLNETNQQMFLKLIQDSLELLSEFQNLNNKGNEFSLHSSDSEFNQFYQNVLTSNICQFLEEEYSNLSIFCTLSFEGMLNEGLIQSANYIVNDITTSLDTFNDSSTIIIQQYESEGAFIVMKIFVQIYDHYKSQLQQDCSQQILFYRLYFYIGMTIMIIIIILFQQTVQRYAIKRYNCTLKFIHIIPGYQLFYDKTIERRITKILK